ncbi:Peptidoglycan/LPS O-acetylase OafA/YrhL, contains acyltransferase and SGNH-hydrolase domains [Pedococcus cremeus]|uniref:Peptidoglycan/LPS O-acetylase OafA/YrhL, contains acyltransferase and SGNH-hydrolase domains n=1 Tax=Pedococcus cremeus TaxID=587636 RepID=A0A1H9XBQ9_9MICO|nr:Peptidoglycan/LPS O-acetylase OafA/YrhL, contains acyltransferase and SGNH-hydrolase domains [Pedococcus cremeus]
MAVGPSSMAPPRRNPALDGLRGLAVLLVILSHTVDPNFEPMGAIGVTIFFVLSGYLITTLLLEERGATGRIDRRRFYSRRAWRLLPALAILLSAEVAWRLAAGVTLSPVAIAASYGTNIAMAMGVDVSTLGHTWSLSLEEQFYLLWPLALPFVMRRNPVATIVFAAAVSGLARVAISVLAPWPVSFFSPATRADAILVGCALAVALRQEPRPSRLGLFAGLAATLLTLSCLTVGVPAAIALIAPASLATALLIARLTATSGGVFGTVLGWSPLRYTGRISYGLYLWHPLMLSMAHVHRFPVVVFTLVSTFAVASISWHAVEHPILRLRLHQGRRMARTVPATAGGP